MTAEECLDKADFEVEHAIGIAVDWSASVLNFTEAMDDGEAEQTPFMQAFSAFAPPATASNVVPVVTHAPLAARSNVPAGGKGWPC